MSIEYRIISIGTLSHNPLWGEKQAVRTAHATTTYVEAGQRRILVDPSLPAQALAARFNERTGRDIQDVTDVFCTTLRPVHRRSINAFEHAEWWTSEMELDNYGRHLEDLSKDPSRLREEEAHQVRDEQQLLEKFKPAKEKLTPQVNVFALPGPSAGSAGLLLTPPNRTAVIAGDAAITADHVLRGQVWSGCADTQAAMRSLGDILELAEIIIPGHDNVMFWTGVKVPG